MVTLDNYMAKFMNHMDEQGEMFFSTGDTESDYDLVKSTIDRQGYWAGNRYRYYFDDNMDLIKVEERRFGA